MEDLIGATTITNVVQKTTLVIIGRHESFISY